MSLRILLWEDGEPFTSHWCTDRIHRACLGFYGGLHCTCTCHEAPEALCSTMKMPEVPK